MSGLFIKAILIMGAVAFAKELPKLIGDITGIKTDGMKLGLNERLTKGGAFFAGSAAAGMAKAGVNRFNKARLMEDGLKKGNRMKTFGSTFAAAGSGLVIGANRGRKAKDLNSMIASADAASTAVMKKAEARKNRNIRWENELRDGIRKNDINLSEGKYKGNTYQEALEKINEEYTTDEDRIKARKLLDQVVETQIKKKASIYGKAGDAVYSMNEWAGTAGNYDSLKRQIDLSNDTLKLKKSVDEQAEAIMDIGDFKSSLNFLDNYNLAMKNVADRISSKISLAQAEAYLESLEDMGKSTLSSEMTYEYDNKRISFGNANQLKAYSDKLKVSLNSFGDGFDAPEGGKMKVRNSEGNIIEVDEDQYNSYKNKVNSEVNNLPKEFIADSTNTEAYRVTMLDGTTKIATNDVEYAGLRTELSNQIDKLKRNQKDYVASIISRKEGDGAEILAGIDESFAGGPVNKSALKGAQAGMDMRKFLLENLTIINKMTDSNYSSLDILDGSYDDCGSIIKKAEKVGIKITAEYNEKVRAKAKRDADKDANKS